MEDIYNKYARDVELIARMTCSVHLEKAITPKT